MLLSSVCSLFFNNILWANIPKLSPNRKLPWKSLKTECELRRHDLGACCLIFSNSLGFNESLSTWADTHIRVFSKTRPRTLMFLWIDQFLDRVFTSPFWALWWRILGKCAGSCVSPIMWWQAVSWVTNEPITALQWRRQVNPLSNRCVQCPLPCSNYPGSDGTFSSNSPSTPADMYLGHCRMCGS